MKVSEDALKSLWFPAVAMGVLIAYAAGQPLTAALVLLGLGSATLFALPMQLAVAVVSIWLLLRVDHPLRRWAWGALVAGILFLSSIPCILLLADIGSANGSAEGTNAAMVALFFTLLIFGLPMLVIGIGLIGVAVVLFRKARGAGAVR